MTDCRWRVVPSQMGGPSPGPPGLFWPYSIMCVTCLVPRAFRLESKVGGEGSRNRQLLAVLHSIQLQVTQAAVEAGSFVLNG